MTPRSLHLLTLFSAFALAPFGARAADAPKTVEPVPLADRVFTFTNTMSNSTAVIGDDAVLLVDSGGSPEIAAQLRVAIAKLTDKPVRLLVDTHWHFDHVNGNEVFGAQGATIVGHVAMRSRMREGRVTNALPRFPAVAYDREELATPTVTFDRSLALHLGGQRIELVHPAIERAHTDGDVVVYFPERNIVHMGDLYFEGTYPFIDVAAGGSIAGMIAGCREVLARIDDQTLVVPGHGPVTDKAHLEAFVAMLTDIDAKIAPLVLAGKTLADVQVANPTAAHDAVWGKSFISPDQFTEIVYNGIVAQRKQ
ncbi:MAG TPA: MBL fold metallo-hydrolase [Opitutaceae bacterium]|nr:MBL fold metallo-hydrolase [Opitutaceae bacterium]